MTDYQNFDLGSSAGIEIPMSDIDDYDSLVKLWKKQNLLLSVSPFVSNCVV